MNKMRVVCLFFKLKIGTSGRNYWCAEMGKNFAGESFYTYLYILGSSYLQFTIKLDHNLQKAFREKAKGIK